MIEIKIPKEIKKYEAKAVGPFTLRQLICLFICLPICVALFMFLSPHIGADVAGFACMPPAGVAYLFGWYKPYGMKFEVYLKTVFVSSFLAPSKRYYKTENFYSDILKEIKKGDAEADLIDSNGKKRKEKKKKYKRSREAIR